MPKPSKGTGSEAAAAPQRAPEGHGTPLLPEQREQREHYYRALIERASDILTLLDADGQIGYESPSVERVLGYTPAELIGRNVFRGMHQDDVATARAAFRGVVDKPGSDVVISLCRFKHKGAGWRTLEVTAANLLDDPLVRGIVVNEIGRAHV